jgi:hypothetical protein
MKLGMTVLAKVSSNLTDLPTDQPILSSKRMLRKNYDHKGSVEKIISNRDPQGVWRQDKLIGGKLPVVK